MAHIVFKPDQNSSKTQLVAKERAKSRRIKWAVLSLLAASLIANILCLLNH